MRATPLTKALLTTYSLTHIYYDLLITSRDLQTPLHLAARLGSYNAAQLLLGYGADPLCRDERNQQACLTLTLTLTLDLTSRHA